MQAIIAITLGILAVLMYIVLDSMRRLEDEFIQTYLDHHKMSHDLQRIYKETNKDAASIKRRQTWSKKREKKDLKTENTGGHKRISWKTK